MYESGSGGCAILVLVGGLLIGATLTSGDIRRTTSGPDILLVDIYHCQIVPF